MSSSSQQTGYLTQSQIDSLSNLTISSVDTIDISSIDLSNISGSTYVLNDTYTTDTVTLNYTGGATGTTYQNNWTASTNFSTLTTSSGTISITPLDINSINDIITGGDWKSKFPDWSRIQKMCDIYPGLKIAFDKFKTTYELVKEDYDNPNIKK